MTRKPSRKPVLMALALVFASVWSLGSPHAQTEPRWFSAWATAHNVGRGVPGLDGASVRLIVRPTLTGQSLRVKLSNIRGSAPAVFAAAFVGVSGAGARSLPARTAG